MCLMGEWLKYVFKDFCKNRYFLLLSCCPISYSYSNSYRVVCCGISIFFWTFHAEWSIVLLGVAWSNFEHVFLISIINVFNSFLALFTHLLFSRFLLCWLRCGIHLLSAFFKDIGGHALSCFCSLFVQLPSFAYLINLADTININISEHVYRTKWSYKFSTLYLEYLQNLLVKLIFNYSPILNLESCPSQWNDQKIAMLSFPRDVPPLQDLIIRSFLEIRRVHAVWTICKSVNPRRTTFQFFPHQSAVPVWLARSPATREDKLRIHPEDDPWMSFFLTRSIRTLFIQRVIYPKTHPGT